MAYSSLIAAKVAEFYGISIEKLLHYEAEGIVTPLRVGVERYYSVRDQIRVQIILKGERLGFSVREIKSLIFAHLPEPCEIRGTKQIRERIDQLESEKLEIQAAIARLTRKIDDTS